MTQASRSGHFKHFLTVVSDNELDKLSGGSGKIHDLPGAGQRYVFLDGVRGLAALAVVFHHLLDGTVLGPVLGKIFPGPLVFFCHYGACGVQVFFVISGFVVAHSLRHVEPTLHAVSNFVLRRQLRLDPPYWTALAVTLAGTALESHLPGLTPRTLPSVGEALANVCYLQNIVGAPQVLVVAWSLCVEVQFYLAFVLIVTLGRRMTGGTTAGGVPYPSVVLVAGMGLLSLVARRVGIVNPPWLVPFWFYFAAGSLCYWRLQGQLPATVFWMFLGAFAVAVWHDQESHIVVGFAAVLIFYVVGRARKLTTWLGHPGFGYLGRISYSLYLVHLPMLLIVVRTGYKLTGESQPAAVCWFTLALLASLAVAHLLHVWVETPSTRLSELMKSDSRASAAVPVNALASATLALCASCSSRNVDRFCHRPSGSAVGSPAAVRVETQRHQVSRRNEGPSRVPRPPGGAPIRA